MTLPLDNKSVDDFGEQSSIEGGRGGEKQLTVEGGQICKEERGQERRQLFIRQEELIHPLIGFE